MYNKRTNPFIKLKIGNNSYMLKKYINISKEEIDQETDRLFLREKYDYISQTFIDKSRISCKRKFRNNSMIYNYKNKKLRNSTNRLENKKDNNISLNNTKKVKLINLKKLLIKYNNKNMNSLNNSIKKINKNECFEIKNNYNKKTLTYRNKDYSYIDKTNKKNNQTMYLHSNNNKSKDLSKNNNKSFLITSLYINKKQNKHEINNSNIDKNQKYIFSLKNIFKKSNRYFSEINDSLIDINKKIYKTKYLKHYQSEGNKEYEQILLNKIKKEKILKKFGKSYEVLGPIKKDFVVSLRQVKIKKKNLDKKFVWMNRTTANLLSFGEVLQKMPNDIFYKERKRIVSDYINCKKKANFEIKKINKKKRLSSAKNNLEINMNKIDNMLFSYKKLILNYNNIKRRINIKD